MLAGVLGHEVASVDSIELHTKPTPDREGSGDKVHCVEVAPLDVSDLCRLSLRDALGGQGREGSTVTVLASALGKEHCRSGPSRR